MNAGVLTISDRSARGEREDASGPLLRRQLEAQAWTVVRTAVVADEQGEIEATLRAWADSGEVDLVLTTGGTGVAERDRAPEATLAVVERQVPGLAEAMRAVGLRSTVHAMLARGVAGIRGRTLIVNMPGSPRACLEGLNVILPALPHAIELLRGDPGAEAGHHREGRQMQA